jgi:hypothetical protein
MTEHVAVVRKINKLKIVCPYCYKSFKLIYRHKCKIAPKDFVFHKNICNNKLFYILYQRTSAFNTKTGRIDLIKLDRDAYRYNFTKVFTRQLNDPKISVLDALHDENFDDEKNIQFVLSQVRKPPKVIVNKAFTRNTRVYQLCPCCGQKYRRLTSHKCHINPEFTFQCTIHPDILFDMLYKVAKIWDPRGFLNLYRFDLNLYQKLFFCAQNALKDAENPSIENIKLHLTHVVDLEKASPTQIQTELPQVLETNSSKIIQKPRIAKIIVQKPVMQVCVYCFQPFVNLAGHNCPSIPENFVFSEDLGKDQEFFRRLYREIGAINRYKKLDLNKLNRHRYKKLFLKYYQVPLSSETDIKVRKTEEVYSKPLEIDKTRLPVAI